MKTTKISKKKKMLCTYLEQMQMSTKSTKNDCDKWMKKSISYQQLQFKKTRRGRRNVKPKVSNNKFSIMGTNAAGIKAKFSSLQNNINQLEPGVIFIQETKLYRKGQIEIPGYEMERVDRDGEGGLLMSFEIPVACI